MSGLLGMFSIKNVSLEDFADSVGFWDGAKERWEDYTQEERDYLEDCIADSEFESVTDVNDFIWFNADKLLQEAGFMDKE